MRRKFPGWHLCTGLREKTVPSGAGQKAPGESLQDEAMENLMHMAVGRGGGDSWERELTA